MERSVRKAILHCLAALAACLAGASVSSAQETAEPTAATVPPVQAAPVILYTKDNAPPTPKLADLPLKESVTRYGVTWTFEKPSPVGQFVNGDWYVVGPAIVVKIDPAPVAGPEVRNGSVLNPPAKLHSSGFDNRIKNKAWWTPQLTAKLPIAMKPGDSLMSSISKEKVTGGLPVKSFSVLTCLKDPVPADALRPGYSDREPVIYLTRNLHREYLPALAAPPASDVKGAKPPTVDLQALGDTFERPWHELSFLEEAEAEYQRGGYGRGIVEIGGRLTLALMLDFKPQEKERLLINYIQYGLDLWGIAKNNGYPGWPTLGGWGSGRKWPIVFAGLMLGDEKMSSPTKTFQRLVFQEDNQTLYDDCWTGAGVMYGGHEGWRPHDKRPLAWGPYENLHPSRWNGWIGTSYRTNMTSSSWIGEALCVRILRAEKEWNYDAFLDYCDRWMYEPDPGYRNPTRISVQGNGWDPFAEAMWKTYREKLPTVPGRDPAQRPTTGWQKKREMKSVEVEVGKNRELIVKKQPVFPIMIFGEHTGRIEDALAIGANVIAEGCFEKPDNYGAYWKLGLGNRKFLDELAAKGLYGIFGSDARVIGHPALLGWIHVDEPDRTIGHTADQLKDTMPGFRIVQLARYAADEKTGLTEPQEEGKDPSVAMVGPAYRWMKKFDQTRPVFLTVGPAFLAAAAEKKDLAADYLKCCEAVGCKVPLAQTGEAVAKLRALAGPGKVVYAWIETKGAKPDEVRAAAIAAIKGGSTAIGYRGFEGLGTDKPDAAVMAELKKINEQITAHAAELLADPAKAETILK